MGYLNPTVQLDFPELGPDVHVIMRNPRLLPTSFFANDEYLPPAAYEEPPAEGETPTLAEERLQRNHSRLVARAKAVTASTAAYTNSLYARLVVSWNVWDAQTGDLLPVSAESIARLPRDVLGRMVNTVESALVEPKPDDAAEALPDPQ